MSMRAILYSLIFFIFVPFKYTFAQADLNLRLNVAGPFVISNLAPENDLEIDGFSKEVRLDLGFKFDEALLIGISMLRTRTNYKYESKEFYSNYNGFLGWFGVDIKTISYFHLEPIMRVGYGSLMFGKSNKSEKDIPSFVMNLELNLKWPSGPLEFYFGSGIRKFLPKTFDYDGETFGYTEFESEFYHSVGIGLNF